MSGTLLTGFEPFGGESENPSWQAIKWLLDRHADVVGVELPCVYAAAAERLTEAVASYQPDVVICVGQAGGRAAVTPERIAVNLDDSEAPDNAGEVRHEQVIVPGGPAAYFSGLPVREIVAAIAAAGIPAETSRSAGGYVCNHAFYRLMHLIATERPRMRGGFIHVPYADTQRQAGNDVPSLPVESIADALEIAVRTSTDRTPR